jgi:hypothetical protein
MHLDVAIKSVKDFLGNLRFTGDGIDYLEDVYIFNVPELGGMSLSGDERKAYFQCLDNLVQAVTKSNSFSRKGLDALLREMLLNARNTEKGSEQLSRDTITQAVRWLRDSLHALPKSYVVYLPVVGLDPECLPVQVGTLVFLRNDSETIESIKEVGLLPENWSSRNGSLWVK